MKLVLSIVLATLAWETIASGFIGYYTAALLGQLFAPIVQALH